MKTASLHSTYGPTGSVSVWRTNLIKSFSFGPAADFIDADRAFQAAFDFRTTHRRSERCSIWIRSEVGSAAADYVEISPAGEAEPQKGERKPKAERGERRKERREKKKADVLAIRERVREAPITVIGVDATEAECPITKRESFKEVRARVSSKANLRVTKWKSKNQVVKTGLGVGSFR